jgi:hypothetical protein
LRSVHSLLQAAKDVVLAQKPVITDDVGNLDPGLLEQVSGMEDEVPNHIITPFSISTKGDPLL